MQSRERRCLAGDLQQCPLFHKCMRKQWIVPGSSTERHDRKREQKEVLQLLQCPLFVLFFLTAVGGQFSLEKESMNKDVRYQNRVGKCRQNLCNKVWIQKKGYSLGHLMYSIYSPFPGIGSTPMPSLYSLVFDSSDM